MEWNQIRYRVLQKFSLELVHGLFMFRGQSVLIQLSFCNKGGIPDTDIQGLSVTRAVEYIAGLRRLLRWSCSDPERDCGFGNCHRKWQSCDWNGYVSKSWLCSLFIGTNRTTTVERVWSEWLSMNHANVMHSVKLEFHKLVKMGWWEMWDIPLDVPLVGVWWVYKINPIQSVYERHKAQLVVKDYM